LGWFTGIKLCAFIIHHLFLLWLIVRSCTMQITRNNISYVNDNSL
jgi:hypothetical protein